MSQIKITLMPKRTWRRHHFYFCHHTVFCWPDFIHLFSIIYLFFITVVVVVDMWLLSSLFNPLIAATNLTRDTWQWKWCDKQGKCCHFLRSVFVFLHFFSSASSTWRYKNIWHIHLIHILHDVNPALYANLSVFCAWKRYCFMRRQERLILDTVAATVLLDAN